MITWHDEVDSTQDIAHTLAQAGAAHGAAIAARRQRAGRGTRGRPWASRPGGLWLSVIGRPTYDKALDPLSLRVGLRVAEAIEAAVPLAAGTIRLKWPNDLMVADRKLAGILCEARWRGDVLDWVVVGVGVNVSNDLPPALASTTHRLADSGWGAGPEALAAPVVDGVVRALAGSGPLTPSELASFQTRDWLRGRHLIGTWAGTARGITPGGQLIVERASGALVEINEAVTGADLAPLPAGR